MTFAIKPDVRNLANETESWLRRLAPLDYPEGLPLYVIPRSTLPDEHSGCFKGAVGVYIPRLAAMARPWLEARRAWKGEGPGVLVDDAKLWEWALELEKELSYTSAATLFEGRFRGIALHEIAHELDRRETPVEQKQVADMKTNGATLSSTAQEIAEQDVLGRNKDQPWRDHDERWIRATLHLVIRAKLIGEPLAMLDVSVADEKYGLSPAEDYLAALGDEPERLARESIRSILATPEPIAFACRFMEDAWRWHATNTPGWRDEIKAKNELQPTENLR